MTKVSKSWKWESVNLVKKSNWLMCKFTHSWNWLMSKRVQIWGLVNSSFIGGMWNGVLGFKTFIDFFQYSLWLKRLFSILTIKVSRWCKFGLLFFKFTPYRWVPYGEISRPTVENLHFWVHIAFQKLRSTVGQFKSHRRSWF